MDRDLLDLSKYRLQKAKEDLDSATVLFENQKYSQSLNRSYYSMFHSTRALLALDKFDSKKHSGVISFFNQSYIKSGKIESVYGRMLMDAQRTRTKSDYDDFYVASKDEAEKQLEDAKAFVEKIYQYLKINGD